jgi:diadenylate cyclase
VNIFVDKTPLHDGAVIIKNNRIAAASCIMPLTKKEIGAEFGTRHRAAVGTSETSDSDVIVVSEETGKISFAKEGTLYKNLARTELERILIENLSPVKQKGLRWKGWGYHEKNN